MEFNFKQFLTENSLTVGSKLKYLAEVEEEDSLDQEPTAKDIKSTKGTADLAKKQNQLATLLEKCPPLKTLPDESKLSDVAKTVTQNYTIHYDQILQFQNQ